MLKVGMIVGSTRPNRFADIPMQWLVEGAAARRDLQLTVLDLRDFRMPLFNEPAPPSYTGGAYTQPEADAWRKRIVSVVISALLCAKEAASFSKSSAVRSRASQIAGLTARIASPAA
jgi:hypothetical protein